MSLKTEKPKSASDKIKLAELAKIHIAKKDLGLDDDTYRDLLRKVNALDARYLTAIGKTKAFEGVISAKYLTALGRAAVLEQLKQAGFTGKTAYPGRPHNIDSAATTAKQLKKLEALLAEAGRPWAYATAMAVQMYKKSKLEFCNSQELAGLIAALTKNAAREGRRER
ncbi:regulatory protein GemA [Methylobacter sp. S3L5C]|uniref:regulatory protein GemA n=1 Tax=Methylobacter sp. S3L5C TaxID=2839024 RepID=UPI001FACC514|nr:regulatory protein GemA [Methylobacter sp. S3L5C]UOA07646.1 regulatory protein GemA [Methylobacter sp. S3L5C]UOA07802.1 regulatory protein GemA [Methylobacter sp. S3L5C]